MITFKEEMGPIGYQIFGINENIKSLYYELFTVIFS